MCFTMQTETGQKKIFSHLLVMSLSHFQHRLEAASASNAHLKSNELVMNEHLITIIKPNQQQQQNKQQ